MHAHHRRPDTLLQLVAEMVEPGHHHLHHRVRQRVQGKAGSTASLAVNQEGEGLGYYFSGYWMLVWEW